MFASPVDTRLYGVFSSFSGAFSNELFLQSVEIGKRARIVRA